jgi:formylglycine-generating enzyme
MLLGRAVKTFVPFCGFLLGACSTVIGSGDLEYTLDDSGSEIVPGVGYEFCSGNAGPVPVNIDGLFCIDSTEVTYAQYLDFQAAAPTEQAPDCEWNVTAEGVADYEPHQDWVRPDPRLDFPVGDVDWCDAWAYCHWAGKRLCAGVAGEVLDFEDYDTVDNELFYACSHDGENTFPYGPVFDPDACVTSDRSRPLPVKSLASCEGGFRGVFDLSGNLAEWQDLCRPVNDDPRDDDCRVGAGAFSASAQPRTFDYWSCATDAPTTDEAIPDRDTYLATLGIRCCSDPL